MTTPPHTRHALEAQMAICQDLLTHFKKDQENFLSLLAKYTSGNRDQLYVAALQIHRSTLINTSQRKLTTELRLLADMVVDDERFAVAEIDKVLHPDTIARPAAHPKVPQWSSRTS